MYILSYLPSYHKPYDIVISAVIIAISMGFKLHSDTFNIKK